MPAERGLSHTGLGAKASVPSTQGLRLDTSLLVARGDHGEYGLLPSAAGTDVLVSTRIDAYRRRYERRGHGLFSAAASGLTPLLDDFRSRLGNGTKKVVEAGAGPGTQAVILAARPDTHVVAVEANADISGIHDTLGTSTENFGSGSQVTVITEDINQYLAGLTEPVDGIHAHSLVHFWDEQARADFYRGAHGALVDGGYLAVSLKADGDVQQDAATIVRRTMAGVYGEDSVDSGITRLFVSDPSAIAVELQEAGFELIGDIHSWEVPARYDFPDEPEDSERKSRFVGFLARKVA